MSSNDFAIEVNHLGKSYNIYRRPQDRLKQSLVPRLQQLVGRTPNRYFREFWALRNVSFNVRKGETVGIIGRNGSGKSTLLQIICGTLSPSTGAVSTRGRIAALLELGSGFNPQFSGRENVYLNGAILGLSTREIDARFDDIARFADIGDFIDQPVNIYSSGMVVRLAFAVQAMVDPDILVVDEALAVGDESFQRKCFARIEELKSKGTSILFVSHSGAQIIELCEKALLLENGVRLLYTEPSKAVRAYHKLIYASRDEQVKLVREYQRADQSGEEISTWESAEPTPASAASTPDIFNPGLVSQTKEIYPIQGAEIQSFRILDRDGRAVNVLQPGEDYSFEVSGQFLSDNDKVYFGIHIRSVSGMTLTGQRYPEVGDFIDRVHGGESFRITYGFRMILLPGAYFVGGGVWSYNEPNCLHRILDALMFRVTSSQKPISFGYVDAAFTQPLLEIT
jgi:lipopolysaccharide transport system ATP-binding protein